ncbi:MAG: methyl-accepting chemotaxis protein [Acidobacteriota bacterium]|nr:methyl-accepting chemotaxis protein [Acidobacteriota bacterium]
MNRSIKASVLAILSFLAAGYLLLLVIEQRNAGMTHQRMARVSTSLVPAAVKMAQAGAEFENSRRRYKDAIMLEDPNALAEADKQATAAASALSVVRDTVAASPQLAGECDAMVAEFVLLRQHATLVYAAALSAKDHVSPELQGQLRSLSAEDKHMSASLRSFSESLNGAVAGEVEAVNTASVHARTIGWFCIAFALVACGGAWRLLQYRVVLPLLALAERMQDIARGDGDLTARLDVHGSPEFGQVARSFNLFTERIEKIVVAATKNARDVAESSAEIARTAQSGVMQATQHREHNARISHSMAQISSAIQAISRSTQSAASDARLAEQSAHSGGQTIQTTVASIQQLVLANKEMAARIEGLGLASSAIGKIIHVIDDIASQTSLLALNASIESARAGEHGRGFAVVANEVRRLAERTGNATREIDSTVRAIQTGTSEVVDAMRATIQYMETGVASAHSAGHALEDIIQGSAALQKMVTEIATASSEQTFAASSVNANLQEMTGVIEVRVQTAGTAVETCDRLSSMASELYVLVSAFKVHATA